MAEKYRKNPKRKERVSVDGVVFTDETVVAGERWRHWTKTQMQGKPPILVRAPADAIVNAWHKSELKKRKEPQAPSVISTRPVLDRMQDKPVGKPKGTTSIISTKPKPEPIKEPPPRPKPAHEVKVMKPVEAPSPVKPKAQPKKDDNGDTYQLTDLPGVGPSRAEKLSEGGYPSVVEVAEAKPEELHEALKGGRGSLSTATLKAMIRAAKSMVE